MQGDWQQYLDQLGARRDGQGVVLDFHNASASGLLVGDHLAILRVAGPDTFRFLQGQITTDMREIERNRTRLGMHLSLKGRGMISFRLMPSHDGVDLVLPARQLDNACERLGKYARFSKVTLTPDTMRVPLLLQGEHSINLLKGHGIPAPEQPVEALHAEHTAVARLDAGERWLLLLDKVNARHLLDQVPVADIGGALGWQMSDILAGEGHVLPETEDLWLPQVLNYDALNGVSFSKGCYLGQEVVARMHFKGKLKQRMHGMSWAGSVAPAPGAVLRDENDAALGEVVHAVVAGDRVRALAVLRLDYRGELRLEGETLSDWRQERLPYPIPG